MYSPGQCRSPILGARLFVGTWRRAWRAISRPATIAGTPPAGCTARPYSCSPGWEPLTSASSGGQRPGGRRFRSRSQSRWRWRASDSTSSTTATTAPIRVTPPSTRPPRCRSNLLGGDAYFWHYKHNIAHHTYPNISGADDDIYMGVFARMSPHDRRHGFHRFQHLYIWALYSLLAVKWQLSDDFRSMIRPGVAATSVPRPRGWNQVYFWAGKACFLMLAFGIPLLVGHRLAAVVGLYLLTMAVLGLTLATVFQLAHCVEEAEFRDPGRRVATHRARVDGAPDRDRGRLRARQPPAHLVPGRAQLPDRAPPVPEDLPRPLPGDLAHRRSDLPGRTGSATPRTAPCAAPLRSHVRWLRHLGRDGDAQPARTRKSNPTLGGSVSGSQR